MTGRDGRPQAEALPLAGRGQGRAHPARPPGAQEPADLRVLRRAARHVPRRSSTPTTSTPWCSCSNGGNFCSGGDVHDIIGPLVAMDMKELLAFTRMTGDLVKAMLNCGKPIIAGDRRRRGRRRRHHRHGLRHPHRHAGGQDRVPVHPRRACRLRHGRLRDPAAHHRPGPRRRAALHRPHHDRRGGRALGLLQPAGRRGGARGRRARPGRAHRRRARPSPTASPRPSSTRNGRWASTRRSRRRRRRRRSACRRSDFERAYRAFVAKEKPVFEGN